jgi:hypothetical protein
MPYLCLLSKLNLEQQLRADSAEVEQFNFQLNTEYQIDFSASTAAIQSTFSASALSLPPTMSSSPSSVVVQVPDSY